VRLQSWRGTTVVNAKPRRSFPWVRVVILAVVLGIAAYLVVPNIGWVRADAQVAGDIIPVTPVYRARITKMFVNCTGSVRVGQPIAAISNFLIQADYQRQYLEGVEQSKVAAIALEQNVATARENAESLHAKYEAAVQNTQGLREKYEATPETAEDLREKYKAAANDERRLEQSFHSYDSGYRDGAVPAVDWQGKSSEIETARAEERSALYDWKAAQIMEQSALYSWHRGQGTEQSTLEAWKRAEQFVNQIIAAQNSKVGSYKSLVVQAQSVANRVGQETLRAPVSGDIVNCIDRPQNVIEPGTPILSIFQPNRAYIVAYFNPNAVAKVHIGQSADVQISGVAHSVRGRVAWIYPNLDALPDDLQLFFWQHVQFSQYRPVKIALDQLPLRDRQQLYYGAKARVSISTAKNQQS
jgi:multidrug resistance efflux pump